MNRFPKKGKWFLSPGSLTLVVSSFFVSLICIWFFNLNVSRADILNKEAQRLQTERPDSAMELYKRALTLQPSQDHFMVKQAEIYFLEWTQEQGEKKEESIMKAVDSLLNAVHANPLESSYTQLLGGLYSRLAHSAETKEEYSKYLDLAESYTAKASTMNPQNTEIWNERATLMLERGKIELALQQLNTSLRLDPRCVKTYNLLAACHITAKRWRDAAQTLDHALLLDPRDITSWNQLGYTKFHLGDMENAILAYNRTLSIDPTNDVAKLNLSHIYETIETKSKR